MRILVVRPNHQADDIQRGRSVLESEISHPSKVVMIIRENTPEISAFADRAAGRADPFDFREVLWVTDDRIFLPGQEDELFEGEDEWCAVLLNLDDEPVIWLTEEATTVEIEFAFLDAQDWEQ